MSNFEYWRLCDQLTLVQAALLMAGHDPSGIEHNVEAWGAEKQPAGYVACRQALIGAITTKRICGSICNEEESNGFGKTWSRFNAEESIVMTDGIAEWLMEKGFVSNFFLPEVDAPKEYLDPSHDRFAPKLAAAIRAWIAVGEDETLKGTPKQRIEKWLRLHAAEYGLVQKDGKPTESAIKEISKIANWNLKGGAPTTPNEDTSSALIRADVSAKVVRLKKHTGSAAPNFGSDDEIPF